MGSQQFCLKWNNHQSNMLAVFEQLLSNEALVDVTLACEGLSLKAHKMVLSACSPFFQALFVENPCKHPIVILKDMRYMDLKAIVEFMYRGEVNVSQDQLSALLKTAETLKVKGLAEVTGENKHGGLVSVDGTDAKPIGTPRAESPPLSKRKRGRPRRRSPSDSNKSDSEDQGAPPATRIKAPESPEIIEDGSLSSDRVTALPAASPSSRTSSTVAVSSTAVPSGAHLASTPKATNSLAASQHTQDSMGDDVGEGDDADFEVEPSNLMEQSMTTENVPVFADVASSSQALGNESQQSHHTGSTSDSTALVPVQASLPSDISISSQAVDIKPSPSSLIPYDDQAISPVVAAPPAASSSADGASSAMMMFMDTSGVPAIPGPSNYHPDKQQSTPSHVSVCEVITIKDEPLLDVSECSITILDAVSVAEDDEEKWLSLEHFSLTDFSLTEDSSLAENVSPGNRGGVSAAVVVQVGDENEGEEAPPPVTFPPRMVAATSGSGGGGTTRRGQGEVCYVCGSVFKMRCHMVVHMRAAHGPSTLSGLHMPYSKQGLQRRLRDGAILRRRRLARSAAVASPSPAGSPGVWKSPKKVDTKPTAKPQPKPRPKPQPKGPMGTRFQQYGGFEQRLKSESPQRPPSKFQCNKCSFSTSYKLNLVVHKQRVHKKNLRCPKCSYVARGPAGLMSHRRLHASGKGGKINAGRVLQCNWCSSLFRTMGSLVNHENAHRRAGDQPGLHQGTPRSPASAALVPAAPPAVRPQWRVHKCCKCDAVFKYQGSLVRHQLIHHRNRGGRPALPKVKVPKRKSSTALVPATAAENDTGEVYRCEACNAKFDNNISLARHKAAHTRHGTWPVKKRPQAPKGAMSAAYAIPTAGPSSSNSNGSATGQRPSTSKSSGGGRCDCDMLSCELCMARLLEDADNFNGGDIEFAPLPLPYPCHICPAEFRSSEELSDHIREHMESFP